MADYLGFVEMTVPCEVVKAYVDGLKSISDESKPRMLSFNEKKLKLIDEYFEQVTFTKSLCNKDDEVIKRKLISLLPLIYPSIPTTKHKVNAGYITFETIINNGSLTCKLDFSKTRPGPMDDLPDNGSLFNFFVN